MSAVATAPGQLDPAREGLPLGSEWAVFAVILTDGSVLRLPDTASAPSRTSMDASWTGGTIAGSDWTLWWQRRRFAGEGCARHPSGG